MGPQLELDNRGSRSVWTNVLGGLVFLGALGMGLAPASCVIIEEEDDDDEYYVDDDGGYDPGSGSDVPLLVDIDTGATLSVEPGDGVGVFVEHVEGGRWRISTSCDTNFSGYACAFNLNLQALGLRIVELQDLDSDDAVSEGVDLVYFDPMTAFDSDAILLDAEPGASLRLEVFLDGQSEPRFTYWIGDGILNTGAPSNPVDFRPAEPVPEEE